MTVQETSAQPRTSARKPRSKPFASGPIRGITNDDEEMKCRILVGIDKASKGKVHTRVPLSDMLIDGDLCDIDEKTLTRLIDELGKARAIYYCEHADEIRLPFSSSMRRAKESAMALTLWTKGKRKK